MYVINKYLVLVRVVNASFYEVQSMFVNGWHVLYTYYMYHIVCTTVYYIIVSKRFFGQGKY